MDLELGRKWDRLAPVWKGVFIILFVGIIFFVATESSPFAAIDYQIQEILYSNTITADDLAIVQTMLAEDGSGIGENGVRVPAEVDGYCYDWDNPANGFPNSCVLGAEYTLVGHYSFGGAMRSIMEFPVDYSGVYDVQFCVDHTGTVWDGGAYDIEVLTYEGDGDVSTRDWDSGFSNVGVIFQANQGNGLYCVDITSEYNAANSYLGVVLKRVDEISDNTPEKSDYWYMRSSENTVSPEMIPTLVLSGQWCLNEEKIIVGDVIYECSVGGYHITKTTCLYGITNDACNIPQDFTVEVPSNLNFPILEDDDILIPVTITLDDGTPLQNAEISSTLGVIPSNGITNEDGVYVATFRDVAPGTHSLYVSATNPANGIVRTLTRTVNANLVQVYIDVITDTVVKSKAEPVPVKVNIRREDNVGVIDAYVTGTLYYQGTLIPAYAITDNLGDATLNFMDVELSGAYGVELMVEHPFTHTPIMVTDSVAVEVIPDYEAEFDAQTIYYAGQDIVMGLTIRDENDNIVDYDLTGADVVTSIGGAGYAEELVHKSYGLYDLTIHNPGLGAIEITITFPKTQSIFTGEVINPVMRGVANLPLEIDNGRRTIEIQVLDQNNIPVEVDHAIAEMKRPSDVVDTLIFERATAGVYGTTYDFTEDGRYVMTLTLEKVGYTSWVDVSHTDVNTWVGPKPVSWGVYAIYGTAGTLLLGGLVWGYKRYV